MFCFVLFIMKFVIWEYSLNFFCFIDFKKSNKYVFCLLYKDIKRKNVKYVEWFERCCIEYITVIIFVIIIIMVVVIDGEDRYKVYKMKLDFYFL